MVERQDELLSELIGWAYERSPHYRQKFDDAAVSPSEIKRVQDLVQIPPLEKSEVLEAVDRLSLIHISEPTRLRRISYAVFCLKKKTST